MKIVFLNQSTVLSDEEFRSTIAAITKQHERDFAPIWGTKFEPIIGTAMIEGYGAFVFVDNADVDGALGYHTINEDDIAITKVFVKTLRENGEVVSVTASHELMEVLVDPVCTLRVEGINNLTYGYEVADPVEEETYDIDGVKVSNFVFPEWFEDLKHPVEQKYDFLGTRKRPFEISAGGYCAVTDQSGNSKQIFGSMEKEQRFKKEDRRGHRYP